MMVSMTETVETHDRSGPDTQTADGTVALRSATYAETDTVSETQTDTNDRVETQTHADRPGLITRWRTHRETKRQTKTETTRRAAQTAAAYTARIRQTAHTTRTETVQTQTDTTAPIPTWMTWIGVWLDRTLGSLPLLAPLMVSGWYTFHVGTQALDLPWPIALTLTLALEGGVWKLARIYEETLVAGDSTMALRLGLGAYIGATGGLIFWHAHTSDTNPTPAAVVSAMSLAGLYIWARTARWARRAQLRARGLVDAQLVKFSAASWLLTPVANFGAMRHAVKYRITSPMDALIDRRAWKAAGKPKLWTPVVWQTDDVDVVADLDDETETDEYRIPDEWRSPRLAIETGSSVPDPFETYGDKISDAPVSPALVSVSTPPAARVSVPRQRPTGPARRETDPVVKYRDYITAVQTKRGDWKTALFLPPRHPNGLPLSEIKAITGLSGQQTAIEVRKALVQLAQTN